MTEDQETPLLPPSYAYTLIVGPDSRDRAWIESTLMRGGLEVAASTEADLLAEPDIVPPHLLVLDDASGHPQLRETFQRLRSHPALHGVPFVILSYDAGIETFSDAISKGAAAYLLKPVSPEELVSAAHKITGWLSSSDRTERRRRMRRPLLMKVEIDIRARRIRVPGQTLDVSSSGCRVELGEPLAVGDLVRVILHGPSETTHLALGAEVRQHRVLADGTHVAGLRFTGTTALLAAKLLGFVHTGAT
ncbi:MAG TPA: PilZ domain-containing protein [Vicinamibacteria bacterium]|nr:PilZ domain-containing protein [Vicinamibacteria bacterium]